MSLSEGPPVGAEPDVRRVPGARRPRGPSRGPARAARQEPAEGLQPLLAPQGPQAAGRGSTQACKLLLTA